MSDELLSMYRELNAKIVKCSSQEEVNELVALANKIEEKELIEKVVCAFKYTTVDTKFLVSKGEFVNKYSYALKELLNSNWNDIDKIMEIIKTETSKQKEKQKEVKENE